jgi:hypothetical protein
LPIIKREDLKFGRGDDVEDLIKRSLRVVGTVKAAAAIPGVEGAQVERADRTADEVSGVGSGS